MNYHVTKPHAYTYMHNSSHLTCRAREEEFVVFSSDLGLVFSMYSSISRGNQDNEITACIFHGQDKRHSAESTFQINCSPSCPRNNLLPWKKNPSFSVLSQNKGSNLKQRQDEISAKEPMRASSFERFCSSKKMILNLQTK